MTDNGNPHHRGGSESTSPDFEILEDILFAVAQGGIKSVATWLKGLYLEGQAFSQDEDSVRWQKLIKDQQLFQAASVIWSITNMESFVLGADDPED